MKKIIYSFVLCMLLIACSNSLIVNSIKVTNIDELNKAIDSCKAGDQIILANGIWKDVQIKFRGKGTIDNPITIKAETTGKVTIEGESYLKFGGEYLVVEGLYFKNGFSPSNAVIDFKISSKDKPDEISNNCKVTNCVIEDFNKPKRDKSDL